MENGKILLGPSRMTTNAVDKCVKDFCDRFWVRKTLRRFERVFGKITPSKKDLKKMVHEMKTGLDTDCKFAYCNPECVGTIFQKGKKMPDIYQMKMLKGQLKRVMNNASRKMRKNIFHGKTNVLKNSFYEKLPRKTRKIIKQKGAISGCAVHVIGIKR